MNTFKIYYRPRGQRDHQLIHQTPNINELWPTISALLAMAKAEGNPSPDFKLSGTVNESIFCMPYTASSISFVYDFIQRKSAEPVPV